MKTVRLGVIGLGIMGRAHARRAAEGQVPRARLSAVCDPEVAKCAGLPSDVAVFDSADCFLKSRAADAVVIATPHPSHAELAVAALKAGLHVLVEKPLAVHVGEARRMIAAHRRRKRQVFAAMFNQRTDPAYVNIRQFVRGGGLGSLQRVSWVITDWFRTDAYYRSSAWRATWRGEGGGVLLNQCPHNLDLLAWIAGMPARVRGFCGLGRRHPVEVEDEVTAWFEYANGATGTFIASTGEAPGTNRLEIAGTRGRLVFEDNVVTVLRNARPSDRFRAESAELFGRPACTREAMPFPDRGPQHAGILQNFVDAILEGTPLVAPAAEGLASLELANAILFSSLKDRTVELPLDAEAYERLLRRLVRRSRP